MKISDAIQQIKSYHYGISHGKPIDPAATRDQILYGDPEQELTGIVTTCFASYQVLEAAARAGANLVICHEAVFWNHGDHTDWLADNTVFQRKKALLDQTHIVVWRDHDFIHSGIPLPDGTWADGIFYGLMQRLGWEPYLEKWHGTQPSQFLLPPTTVSALGQELMDKLHLNGIKVIGSPDSPARRVWIPGHIMGFEDNKILQTMEQDDIDTLIVFECTDYTVSEYVRDATQSGKPKTILAVGHFNTEEPGMWYLAQCLPKVLPGVPCQFIPSTDMYRFLTPQSGGPKNA